MSKLTEWLSSFPQVSSAGELRVTIRGTTYEAARYVETLDHNGKPYTQEKIYCLGALPACYRRSRRVAFNFPNDSRDWYIAAYLPRENLRAANAKFHPFGINFLLMPWGVPDGSKIDSHEARPYRRFPVKAA